jgi:nicotinamide riboside kinase
MFQKHAFVGTSCVGKTALLHAYEGRDDLPYQLETVPEAARDYFARHPGGNRFSAEIQGNVQMTALTWELAAHGSDADVIMCDRSIIDAVVYTEAAGDPAGAQKLLEDMEWWLPSYTSFWLLDPADIPYATDAIRVEDATQRQQFHEGFLRFFQRTGLGYTLLSGTLEERMAQVDQRILEGVAPDPL